MNTTGSMALLAAIAVSVVRCDGSPDLNAAAGAAAVEAFAAVQGLGTETSQSGPVGVDPQPDAATIRKRNLARLGLDQLEKETWEEAAATLATAIEAYPELRPFLRLRRASALERLNRIGEAIAEVEATVGETTDPISLDEARITRVRLLSKTDRKADLESAFERIMAIQPGIFNDKALVDVSDSLSKAGRGDLATRLRFHLLSDYPRGRYTEKLYDQLTALEWSRSPFGSMRFEQLIDLAEKLSRVNRNAEAIDLIGRIRRRFKQKADDPGLRWAHASALFRSRRYREVVRIDSKPGEAHHISMLRLQAHAQWRTGNEAQFVELLEELLKRYPSHSEATTARILLGNYYLTDGDDFVKAADYFEKAIETGGSGDKGENIWMLAWIHIAGGGHEEAVRTMERYLRLFPDSDYTSNALFWLGKIHLARGEQNEAGSRFGELIRLYPYNYYSYRAREILGDPATPPSEIDGARRFPASSPGGKIARDPRFAVVRELEAIEHILEATVRFEALVEASPRDVTLALGLAQRYVAAARPLDAIRLLNRHFSDTIRHGGSSIPNGFWETLYPRPYWSEIESAASEHRVDPLLMAAIIRQESGFDPNVVSGAGAVGLMQIMPAEASRIARQGGIAGRISRASLFDPGLNARLGAAEIAQTLRTFDRNEVLAIAAYNAGEVPVKRWLSETPIDDLDFFVESIPYAETRLYVKIVHRNRKEYERVYGSPAIDKTDTRLAAAPGNG